MDVLFVFHTYFWPLIIAAAVFFSFWISRSKDSQRKFGRLPPGPTPAPVVGNFFQIFRKEPYKYYLELSKKHGSVFTLWFANTPVVVISGYQALKDSMIGMGSEFSGRANYPILMKVTNGYGILVSSGERWKQLRRFSLSTLKNFGMGRHTIEDKVKEEAKCLVQTFSTFGESPFNPGFMINKAVCNVICSIIFGQRFEFDDPRLDLMIEAVIDYFRVLSSPLGQEKHNPNTEFNFNNLLSTTWSMFSAGTETTSSSIRQSLLLMMKHPDVQARVQREIDEVVGHGRCPSLEDRQKMPYTDAVIHEVQRHMDLAPTAVPHKMFNDTEFKKYLIPKGTIVLPLLSSVLSDPTLWKNPNNFDPENFLDEEGQFKKNDAFVVFGMGKRACLGEALARVELFILFTSLLQHFTFKATQPHEKIDITPAVCSFGRVPRFYQCYAVQRA
ncbi:Cytochrome P450 2M1 [Bagarius yarrelli]|uniref:Cytochrome P450 2M1 n=1 Tax=Bagarius yarrelli TaxID=175774 RepID=A0A556U788_BAGYA|nr:Cytochrome P450 2M1 [Bagarius yarrelli]